MEYTLLTADQLPETLSFLNDDIMTQVREHSGWVVIGEEDNSFVTVAAITRDERMGDTIELAYIYTIEEKRMEDYALGLLSYVEDTFKPLGIKRIIACPMGTMEEISDIAVFLDMADFVPLQVDWHVLQYSKSELLQNPVLQKVLKVDAGRLEQLSLNEIKYFLGKSEEIVNQKLKDDLLFRCYPKNSRFVLRNGKIEAAVLCQGKFDAEANIINLYINPKSKKKQHVLSLLAEIVKILPQETEFVNISVDDNRKLDFYTYLFGQPLMDYWVQSYQHVYTDNRDLEEV